MVDARACRRAGDRAFWSHCPDVVRLRGLGNRRDLGQTLVIEDSTGEGDDLSAVGRREELRDREQVVEGVPQVGLLRRVFVAITGGDPWMIAVYVECITILGLFLWWALS